ncbi:MAG: serine/threonine-protein kinase [Blastocatellia bacterium]
MDRVEKVVSKTKEDPWIGKTVAEKYLLEKLIGTGGMGSVYAGKHVQLGRAIAVKVMNADTVSDEVAIARFIREAKTAAKLDHANAVTIHDFGSTSNGGAFIVMEYINGQSLRKYLSKHGALSLKQTLSWFMPICEVVEAAHQRGIIHRDLKPENIMLKEIGEEIVIKVVDFGLAKLVTNTDASQKLTKTGEFMGTPQYMAPEVYDGEPADHRTDIYALGIILYEMISGKIPFAGSVQNIISGHLFNEPKPIASINPNLPTEIDQVLALALEKNRDKRISSAVEFANAFKKALSKIGTQQIIKQAVATELKNISSGDETNLPTVRDSIAESKNSVNQENDFNGISEINKNSDVAKEQNKVANTSLLNLLKENPILLVVGLVPLIMALFLIGYFLFNK